MRLDTLISDSLRALELLRDEVTSAGREIAATFVLFSGGNDSTVLAHLFRHEATHFVHCNTGIGVEQTRQFVRDRAVDWDVPLLEFSPDEVDSYRHLVINHGFPGPAHHYKMYQRLKERQLRKARRAVITDGRRQRVIYLAGRRRAESNRRAMVPERDTEGSVEWLSPLVEWTDDDMAEYRDVFELPRNEVTAMLHMSGECLCGAFAAPGELDEIKFFFPEVAKEITDLELATTAAGCAPTERCKWGWGAYREYIPRGRSGPLCSSCEGRQLAIDLYPATTQEMQ